MYLGLKVYSKLLVATAAVALLLSPAGALAQEHVVPGAEVRDELRAAAAERERNIEGLQEFFSSNLAGKALATAKVDAVQVQQAIPQLSDAELGRLAAQTQQLESDFAAGLTTRQVTYIILGAIGVAIIAIVAAA